MYFFNHLKMNTKYDFWVFFWFSGEIWQAEELDRFQRIQSQSLSKIPTWLNARFLSLSALKPTAAQLNSSIVWRIQKPFVFFQTPYENNQDNTSSNWSFGVFECYWTNGTLLNSPLYHHNKIKCTPIRLMCFTPQHEQTTMRHETVALGSVWK